MSVDYCPCGHEEDNDQHACPVTQKRLRATLSLAEEGLANYAQEMADLRQAYDYHKGNAERLKAANETLSQQRDHWLNVARNKDAQVERLKAALERIGHHGDEENEWDAVERYDAVRTWAMEALGEFPDGLREPQ